MTRPNGYVLHEDNQRVVIATGFTRVSKNVKTGEMIQVWILAKDVNPIQAVKTGADSSNCGNCPLRGTNGVERACYVNVGQAPLTVYRAYKRGSYPRLNGVALFDGRSVRWGAYGDPAYIPAPILDSINSVAASWTGYTHQWRKGLFSSYRRWLMASVESTADASMAHELGWRTFRVETIAQPIAGEIECPAYTQGIQCVDCGLCMGASKPAKSIVVTAHGVGKVHIK